MKLVTTGKVPIVTPKSEALVGSCGRHLKGGMCNVFLPEEDRVVSILAEHLEPVVPKHGEQVKVIMGDEREAVGTLLSIDNMEGVVKLSHGDVKMVQLRYLCKMR